MMDHKPFLDYVIQMALDNVKNGGKPYSAVIVKDNVMIASAVNESHIHPDATLHAELLTIQKASQILQSEDLNNCILYASGEPCDMCRCAAQWANLTKIYYLASRDEILSLSLQPPLPNNSTIFQQLSHNNSLKPFKKWLDVQ